MKCRKLYQNENEKNYNLVFFKSKGTRMPNNIKCAISKSDDKNIIFFGNPQEIIPGEDGDNKTIDFKISNEDCITMTFNLHQNDKEDLISKVRINYNTSFSIVNERFYISFYSEETEGNKNIIYQSEFKLETINGEVQSNGNIIEKISYKDVCLAIKTDSNFGEKQEGISYSLTQRLSILKGELWYNINYGLPLLDKVRSGAIFDSVIINIILRHPEVKNITSFSSSVENHSHYKFNAIILTIYNQYIELSNSY